MRPQYANRRVVWFEQIGERVFPVSTFSNHPDKDKRVIGRPWASFAEQVLYFIEVFLKLS